MRFPFELVSRALLNIGMAPVTDKDKEADNEAWRTAKAYCLQTMLETLEQVEWTGAKRRRELAPERMPHKGNAGFARAYALPLDCAKPIELDGNEFFVAEGRLLFTSADPARLLYVSNGRRLADQKEVSGGGAFRSPRDDYFSGGDARRNRRYEHGDNILAGRRNAAPVSAGAADEEDFPDFWEPRFEPNFFLYWENMLSAKYALRLTDKPDLAAAYFNKAAAVGREAAAVSDGQAAARKAAPASWQEELGLR